VAARADIRMALADKWIQSGVLFKPRQGSGRRDHGDLRLSESSFRESFAGGFKSGSRGDYATGSEATDAATAGPSLAQRDDRQCRLRARSRRVAEGTQQSFFWGVIRASG
jgi:hypothetical protein